MYVTIHIFQMVKWARNTQHATDTTEAGTKVRSSLKARDMCILWHILQAGIEKFIAKDYSSTTGLNKVHDITVRTSLHCTFAVTHTHTQQYNVHVYTHVQVGFL